MEIRVFDENMEPVAALGQPNHVTQRILDLEQLDVLGAKYDTDPALEQQPS